MAGFGAIAGGVGTILSGASSLFSGIGAGKRQRNAQKWMEKMNKQNQQFQKDYTKYQNDLERENQELYWQKYNSPAAQRFAMEAAGINPFVEGSVMQPMQADSSVSGGGSPGYPTPPDYVTPGLGAIQDFGSSLSTLGARLDSIKADTELKNAQAAKVQSETIAQNNVNSIFDLTKAITEFDFLSKKYKTAVDKLNAEWAPIEKMQDAAEKQAAIEELRSRYTKQLAEAAKTDADREINKVLSEKLGKVYDADAALKDEQAKTEGAKREELGASAGLKSAQTETENELRRLRKGLTQNQINKITQDIRSSRVLSAEGIEKLYAWLRGDRDANSLFGLIDKYVTGSGKDLLSSRYNNDIRSYLYALLNGVSE